MTYKILEDGTKVEFFTKNKHYLYISTISILVVFFYSPLRALVALSLNDEKYSHLILIPFISFFFVFTERKQIILSPEFFLIKGCIITCFGIVPLILSKTLNLNCHPILEFDFIILSFLIFFAGISLGFYGPSIFSPIHFSWFFILLFIPVPTIILTQIIQFFRYGSAEVVDLLFQITGMNYIREDLTFHLSNISIFIAEECSGIRSSIALIITTLIAGHIFLTTIRGKTLLLFFVPLLTILKNGIRITTLTILAEKVDTAWLTSSNLHHNGGVVFFGLILLLLFAILIAIQKIEVNFFRKNYPAHSESAHSIHRN
jgi:exosortase